MTYICGKQRLMLLFIFLKDLVLGFVVLPYQIPQYLLLYRLTKSFHKAIMPQFSFITLLTKSTLKNEIIGGIVMILPVNQYIPKNQVKCEIIAFHLTSDAIFSDQLFKEPVSLKVQHSLPVSLRAQLEQKFTAFESIQFSLIQTNC